MSELPKGWDYQEVGSFNNHKGKNIKPSDFPDEVFEVFSVPTFASGKPEYLKGSDIGSSKQVVQSGDVLVCKINPRINRVWVVPTKGKYRQIASSEWINVRNEEFDSRYLKYAFTSQSFRDLICSEVTGVGGSLTRAQPKKVAGYKIPVAPIHEQKRIADKLDSVLAKVEAAQARLDKIPAILKRFRQSVLAAATSGELTKDWRGGEPFMADDIVLKEVVEIDIGHAFKSKEFEDKGIRLLRGQNIEPGALRWSETKYFPKDKLHKFSHLFIRAEDIILAMDRPIVSAGLKLAKAKESDLPCVLVQRVARFSPSAQIVNDFLYYLLLSPDFSSYLLPKQTGSDIPHISGKQILNYSLQLPHIDEQKAIVAIVSELFEHASSVQKQYSFAKTRLDKLTQSILAKAFRGELLSSTVDSDIEAIENSVEALNA